jgi:PREDICTED: similar to ATP-binding cassette, sub-family G (WHITE), member 1
MSFFLFHFLLDHCIDFNLNHKSNAEDVINNIIGELGLENCADIRVAKCSSGQAKRLSFALELISKPKILILDEPFSGLDYSSALQCVKLLKRLTSPCGQRSWPLGIIASIHQPSVRLLYTFEYLYILTKHGHCLYQGFASDLVSHFVNLGLKCPQFHNPADFVIEIASGEYGQTQLQTICDKERSRHLNNSSDK